MCGCGFWKPGMTKKLFASSDWSVSRAVFRFRPQRCLTCRHFPQREGREKQLRGHISVLLLLLFYFFWGTHNPLSPAEGSWTNARLPYLVTSSCFLPPPNNKNQRLKRFSALSLGGEGRDSGGKKKTCVKSKAGKTGSQPEYFFISPLNSAPSTGTY